MGTPVRISLAVAIVMCVLHHPAAAQSADGEALFRDGRKLVKEGKLAEGCAKIAASERVETSTGTLLNLGDCREKLGQLASSWAAFAKAATTAKKDGDTKREGEARRRAKLLEPKLAKLIIHVTAKIDGLEIRRDEDLVDPALWNSDAPVDAASYKISASALGYKPWSTSVVTKDGTKTTVEVPALERDTNVPKPPPEEGTSSPPDDEPEPVTRPGTFTTLRKVSVGVGIIGLVGVGLGVTFGLKSRDLEDQANAICPDAACADPRAVSLNSDAQTNAMRANIALIGGGVAVAGAVVLWFVGAPKATSETLSLAPAAHGTGLAIVGELLMRALATGLLVLAACSVPDKFLIDGGGTGDIGDDGATGDAIPSGNIVWIRSMSTFTTYGLAAGSGGLTMSGGFTVPGDLGGGILTPNGNYDMVVAAFNESDASHIYSKRHGDTGSEFGFMEVADSTGSPIVYGLTGLTPYDVGQGSTTSSGGADGFIGRYGAAAPAWVNRMYGALDEKFLTSARGAGSTVYGAGFFEGSPTWNGATLTAAGGRDAFLVRMNTFTGVVDLTKQYGSTGRDEVSGLASVTGGGVIMTGFFDDTIFTGPRALTATQSLDMYIAKLDTTGDPIWTVMYGGAGEDRDVHAAIDNAGDVYITGNFQQSITFGTTTLTSNGGFDVFVAKLDGTNGAPIWATSWGGTGDDGVRGTMVDAQGRMFVAGWAVGAIDNGTTLGGADAVITSYKTSDGSIRWRHVYSTAGDDRAWPTTFGTTGDYYVGVHLGGAYDFGTPIIGPATPTSVILRFSP